MADNLRESLLYSKSPFYQFISTLLVMLVIGGGIFIILLIPGVLIINPDLEALSDPSSFAVEKNVLFLRYFLISQHLSLFIIPGIILLYLLRPPSQINYPELKIPDLAEIVYIIIIAFCLFPLTGITGELNSGMDLPEWLSGIENWMREKEDMAEQVFNLVMTPGSIGTFVTSMIMIAILPAIGEELIFRGIFQRIFTRMLRSGNLAVFITAFLFSALHFQFYGFIPRFILGLVYGYLFLWSGTLWLPVIAHFINNAVPLIATYIQNHESLFSPVEIPVWKQLIILPLPLLAITIILSYFKSKAVNKNFREDKF